MGGGEHIFNAEHTIFNPRKLSTIFMRIYCACESMFASTLYMICCAGICGVCICVFFLVV